MEIARVKAESYIFGDNHHRQLKWTMKARSIVGLSVLLQSCLVLAVALPHDTSGTATIKRQSGDLYAPSTTACPSGALVRDANAISSQEADYINRHRDATQQAWNQWLSSSSGPNLDGNGGIAGGVSAYTGNTANLPKVAIALSGGGLKAMLNGIGYLQGLDSRNDTAVSRGTGGFLQLASYVAGLSGGGWAVGSLTINDWPTSQSLLDSTYNLSAGLLYTSTSNPSATSYNTVVGNDLTAKANAGYQVSLIDYWGRQLSKQFVSDSTSTNTAGLQWSSIQQTQAFTSAAYPFPLVTMLQSIQGRVAAGGNGTVWEVNAYETGSWDEGISAFTPTTILGSSLSNGMTANCITGYDNFGYIIGLSSAIFNTLDITSIAVLGPVFQALQTAFGALSSDLINPFATLPNPFRQYTASPLVTSMENVTFVDGGEDGQAIPMVPLLQPARALDLILAVDSGSDTMDGWPAGYSLYATYQRFTTSSAEFGEIPLPRIPFVNTFINQGLNTRPTFFGCNSATDVINANSSSTSAPIIAYIPNYPWSALTNYSGNVFQLSDAISQATLDNGFQSATLAGITSGSVIDWPTCLACASLQRSFERSQTPIPDKCQSCMTQYCWNGVVNETTPSTIYAPSVGTPQWVSDRAKTSMSDGAIAADSRHPWILSALLLTAVSFFMLL